MGEAREREREREINRGGKRESTFFEVLSVTTWFSRLNHRKMGKRQKTKEATASTLSLPLFRDVVKFYPP